jgi:hypothetical protein
MSITEKYVCIFSIPLRMDVSENTWKTVAVYSDHIIDGHFHRLAISFF